MKYKISKTNLRPWAVLALAAGLAVQWGCSRDEGPDGGNPDEVTFTASIAEGAAGVQAARSPHTRTTNGGNDWVIGDEIGIFMLPTAGSAVDDAYEGAYNKKFTISDTETGRLTPVDGKNIKHLANENVDFIAYYPYDGTGDNLYVATTGNNKYLYYKVDITDQSDPAKLDILLAKAVNLGKPEGPVNLRFEHMMSKITLQVKAGDGVSASDVADMVAEDVEFDNFLNSAEIPIENGPVYGRSFGIFNPLKTETPDGYNAAFSAIVVPGVDGGSRSITFTVNNRSYVWNIPDNKEFEQGKHHVFPVTISEKEIVVGDATIVPWDEDTPIEADPKIPEYLPESNSYMLKPNSGPVLIPISRANKAADPVYNLGADATGLGGIEQDNYTVELVWSDAPSQGSDPIGSYGVVRRMEPYTFDGDYIYLEPGNTWGNAVICIKVDGVIKWSWHVWVTDKVGFATDNMTGLTWMDRNLGAAGTTWNEEFKNGLFYQWGRKDAFPANGAIETDSESTPFTTLSQLVQNPGVFTTNDSYQGSAPNTSSTANPSWGESGQKTIYDPCPPGWRVPPIQVEGRDSWGDESNWDSFENNGRIFKGLEGTLSIYFPAAGYRLDSSGQLRYPGSNGFYWSSSSASGTTTWALYFYSGAADRYSYFRRYGFSVRCVAE